SERAALLKALLEENTAALGDDLSVAQQLPAAVRAELGGTADPNIEAFLAPRVEMARQQQAAEAEALRLNPRKVLATLILLRGALPVTPCALQLLGGAARDDRSPRNDGEAMREPRSLTLEARFNGPLDSASPRFVDYLCRVRATPAPRTQVRST